MEIKKPSNTSGIRPHLATVVILSLVWLSTPPTSADTPPLGTPDADSAELLQQAEQMKANFAKLNENNPILKQTGAPPLPGDLKPDAAFEKLNNVMKNPALQAYMKVFSNPALINQFEQVLKNPNRQAIFFAEAVLFILFLMYRAWCAVKITHWFLRFIIRGISNLVYFAFSSVAIPYLFIGTPYYAMCMTLFQSVMELFKGP